MKQVGEPGADESEANAPVFTLQALYEAFLACRRRKRQSANAQRYEMRLLDNLHQTLEALHTRSYLPTQSLRFVALKPKAREIHAAHFSDRVVHHWLVPRLEAIYEPVFIHDVYSNRKDKGTHKAVDRLQAFMHAVGNAGWFLQLDIANFFNSIDRPTLFQLLQHRLRKAVRCSDRVGGASAPMGLERVTIAAKAAPTGMHHGMHGDVVGGASAPITGLSSAEHETLRWLCHVLLRHDSTRHAVYRGDPARLNAVPKHKLLGQAGEHKGLPIGNLTSQFFANVYLNELDQFIKHQLKCRYYLRFVDDFVLLADSPERLRQWRAQIETFLAERLALTLKHRAEPLPVKSGADFLGYIVRPHYRLVRRRVEGNLREKLRGFAKRVVAVKAAPTGTGGDVVGGASAPMGLERTAIAAKAAPTGMHGDVVGGASAPSGATSRHLRLQETTVQHLRTVLASYWGHFGHADSHRLRAAFFREFSWLGAVFFNQGERLRLRYEPDPASFTRYRGQIRQFRRLYPHATLHVERGVRRFVYAPNGTPPLNGMPAWPRITHVHIRERGRLKGGLKRRCAVRLSMHV